MVYSASDDHRHGIRMLSRQKTGREGESGVSRKIEQKRRLMCENGQWQSARGTAGWVVEINLIHKIIIFGFFVESYWKRLSTSKTICRENSTT